MSTESKPICVVRAPCATRSGYGDMSRDIIRHLIEYDKYDVKVISVNWGETPMNALDENNPKDKMILDRILTTQLTRQPELFVTITIPSEFETLGKYNIGITAGIETTIASAEWITACNKMDVVFTISEHSKNVFLSSKYKKQGPQQQDLGTLEIERDRYGRPLIVPPSGGKAVAYTRATTIANSLDDASALVAWKMRMAAIGLTTRPDILLSISAAQEDKMAVNSLIEDAMQVAGANKAANT